MGAGFHGTSVTLATMKSPTYFYRSSPSDGRGGATLPPEDPPGGLPRSAASSELDRRATYPDVRLAPTFDSDSYDARVRSASECGREAPRKGEVAIARGGPVA